MRCDGLSMRSYGSSYGEIKMLRGATISDGTIMADDKPHEECRDAFLGISVLDAPFTRNRAPIFTPEIPVGSSVLKPKDSVGSSS